VRSGRAANSLRSNSAAPCPAHTLCLTKSHGWRGADHPPGSPPLCQGRKTNSMDVRNFAKVQSTI